MTAIATTSNCVSLWFTEPSRGCTSAARLGTSTQISGFGISALAFHPCMEHVLAASMDGTVHFLSTSLGSPCVTTGYVSLPALCSSVLKAPCTLHPPPRSGCSKLTSERVSVHAAAVRAGEQTCWGATAKTESAASLPEVAEWCSTIQRVLSMRFVSSPHPAEVESLNGGQVPSASHGRGGSAERSLFPEPWRLVVITGSAALTLNPAGMLLSELNPFGPSEVTSAIKSCSANCSVRVAPACCFMAGACAIAPTCVRFARPCQQSTQHRSSKHNMPARGKFLKSAQRKPSAASSKGARSFVGHSLRLPSVGSGADTHWESLESDSNEDLDAEIAQEAEAATAHGVMCVVAGEFGAHTDALWLRGDSGAAFCLSCCWNTCWQFRASYYLGPVHPPD